MAGGSTYLFNMPFTVGYTRYVNTHGPKGKKIEFSGMWNAMKMIRRIDGFRGLWKGFTVSLTHHMVYRGAYFGLFDTAKAHLFPKPKEASIFKMWGVA